MFATFDRRRETIIAAALVFLAVLIANLLLTGAAPGAGDEAEAQTVPFILGIPHPTGFPAYVLTGWIVTHIVPFSTVAWRLNAYMGFLTALSAAGVVLLGIELGGDAIASAFAGCIFAFGGWVWFGAVHANAQPLATTLSIFAILASVIFARTGNGPMFVGACAACGFALATHPVAMFVTPSLAVALAWQRRTITPSLLISGASALLAPLALYTYLPLRSLAVALGGLDPAAHAPLLGSGSIDWDTDAPRTFHGFLDEVLGRREGADRSLSRTFGEPALTDFAGVWYRFATHQFASLTLILAALGTATLAWLDLRALTVLAAGTLGGIVFSTVYQTDNHIERYVVVSFAVVAALVATCSRIRLARIPAMVPRTVCAVVLVGLLIRAVAINHAPIAATATNGDKIITAVVQATPANAIVVAEWNDATTLAYGAYVERTLGTRIVISAWPAQFLPNYTAWNAQRPVFVLDGLSVPLFAPGQRLLREVPFSLAHYRLYKFRN